MLATKAAWPSLYKSATRGRLACTPNCSHGCEPFGVETLLSKDCSRIIPALLIATSPRAAVYSSNKSLPFSFLVHLPHGINILKLSQPPDMKSTCKQNMPWMCHGYAMPSFPCTP